MLGKIKRNGFGIFTDSKGNIFEGDWKNNFKHGKGVLLYNNKDKYEGDWKNNFRHGKGKLSMRMEIFMMANGLMIKKRLWKIKYNN